MHPVTASISNAMGLVAGNAAGAWGYRKELAGRGKQLLRLLPASLLGGITGAWLLLHLPEKVFHYAAPVLMVLALLMVVFQPRLQRWVREPRAKPRTCHPRPQPRRPPDRAGVPGRRLRRLLRGGPGHPAGGHPGRLHDRHHPERQRHEEHPRAGREHRGSRLLPDLRLRPDQLAGGGAHRRQLR